MKLRDYKIIDGYTFSLIFEDGTNKVIDLSPLIQFKVSKSEFFITSVCRFCNSLFFS